MSVSMNVEMNANVFNGISEVIMASIMASLVEAGNVHGFDGAAEFERQGLQLVVKAAPKKKSREVKEKKEKMILPFEKSQVNYELCQGIVYNKGLFTQCEKNHLENGKYCKSCQLDASKNESCEPLCGNVDRRLYYGLYDYKDNKGRSPKNYGEFIENLGLNITDIEVRALRELNYKISPEHLAKPEKKESTRRGRPKKDSVPIECKEVSDIFSELTKAAGDDEKKVEAVEEETKAPELKRVVTDEMPEVKAKREEKAKKGKMSDEEKMAKEAKKEEEKKAKEAKKEAEKKEREAKKEAEKKEKEAKKEAEKKLKEAEKKEKEAKKEAEKLQLQKEAEKKQKEEEDDEEPEEKKVTVCRIQINKKNYLIDKSTNVLYDAVTKDEVGVWNAVTKTIEELPEEDEEQEDSDMELDDDDYN